MNKLIKTTTTAESQDENAATINNGVLLDAMLGRR
jgi:hypothetical protein